MLPCLVNSVVDVVSLINFLNIDFSTGLKNQVKSTNEWIDNARHRIFFNEFKVGILGKVAK